ncbi:SDR family NAD(P)-dependent oxidoreductase [Roseococcus pinisoli]|uniref:SDR family oxidoreductase n=1 Tax=Roseococcus pinisoli TaxID=2835040 RepID=A0ABS5QCN0_9PROT|nr:SDR family oxidoreductase [Roseococcus pinisoli]MBS7811031.1 SDR family oxidoreductase [Roseococcus pinisoli]
MTIRDIFSVEDKTAIVTGGASGIGLAIAEGLAENGARVAIIDSNGQALATQVEALRARGLQVQGHKADVRDREELTRTIGEAVTALGGLDILFANAGVTGGYGPSAAEVGRLENLSAELWQSTLDINLTGVLHTLQASLPALRRQGSGKIVVTASIAGLRANPAIGYAYTASKTALVNLIKELALELAPAGIQVNGLAPGPFLTNINGGRFHDAANATATAATVPLGRLAQPAEIKGLALLLASSASSYITGAVIPIDGGATAGA